MSWLIFKLIPHQTNKQTNKYNNFTFFTAKPGKPDTPEIVSKKNDSITLAYKPPKDDGGAEIFNYVHEYRAEGAFKWVRATEETVSGLTFTAKRLTTGASYEFRFAAENKAGVGPMSDPTEPVEAKEPIGKQV